AVPPRDRVPALAAGQGAGPVHAGPDPAVALLGEADPAERRLERRGPHVEAERQAEDVELEPVSRPELRSEERRLELDARPRRREARAHDAEVVLADRLRVKVGG